MRVTVIGAGVAGLACAAELAERGAEVTVVDRGGGPGAGSASWLAGGMLAPWCEREAADAAVARLGAMAVDWWAARVPGVRRNGTLVVAPPRDRAELDRFAGRTEEFERVGAERIAALEPDLAGRFEAGLFFASEGHLDPRAALIGLVGRLSGMGVRFAAQPPAEAGAVVDCRGFAARDALTSLRGVRGEMLVLRTREVRLSRPVRLLHPRVPVYVVPRGDGLFMVGATMVESAEEGPITARAALELLGAAYALHPAFAEAEIVEIGTGIRPAFPDNLPRVVPAGNRVFVNGFYRHGFLLAPAVAAIAAGVVLNGTQVEEKLCASR